MSDSQITRDYMAQGYDGFSALKGRKFIIDDENGQIMSSIIRSFLLGRSDKTETHVLISPRLCVHFPAQTARPRLPKTLVVENIITH